MKKTYFYRKHLRLIKRYFWIPIFLLCLILLPVMLFAPIEYKAPAITISLVLLLELFLINKLYKRFVSAEFTISDEGISLVNNKRDIFMSFNDISRIDTHSINNLGGFFTIIGKNNEKIKVTIVLENIGDFVRTLKEKLIEHGNICFNEEKLFKFYKFSLYGDDSWERIYQTFPEVLYYIFFDILLFVLSSVYDLEFTPIVLLSCIIIDYIIYIIVELAVFSRGLQRSVNKDTWDYDKTKANRGFKFVKWSNRIPIIIIFITFIIDFFFLR